MKSLEPTTPRHRSQSRKPDLRTASRRAPSPSKASLIRSILNNFTSHWCPGAVRMLPEPGRNTRGTTKAAALTDLGLALPPPTRRPDVVLHDPTHHRLFLIDAALRTVGMDEPRRLDLTHALAPAGLHVICITALPSRRYLPAFAARVAWDSQVWLAEEPEHLIHFKREGVLRPRGTKV